MAGMEWVQIEHPKLDAPSAQVTKAAYEAVWKGKGFRIVKKKKDTD